MAGPTDQPTVSTDVPALADGLLAGQRRALARALTLIEDGSLAARRELVQGIHPHTGRARTIGISGSPGVGKSTLTDALIRSLRAAGRSVGVVAVDPSSPFSGGALLGDRVRMSSHHADAGVFIRSMATRGHLGGLAVAVPHAVLVLDAAGFDDVLIETVGVGQSEVEVTGTADTTIIALAPGMGDGIQAAKAGILEVADVFVINKADVGGAGKLESELTGMLELGHAGALDEAADATWWPPIQRTVAVRDEGLGELVAAIDRHTAHLATSGQGERRRRVRARHLLEELVLDERRRALEAQGSGPRSQLDELAAEVAGRRLDPYTAADRLLAADAPASD